MKRFISISRIAALVLVLLASVSGVSAQTPQDVFNQAGAAIAKANDAALAAHFNSSVEVTLPGSDANYTSTQAQFVMKDFFTKNPPSGYKALHNGESGGTWYATGTYTSSKGAFDTNIFIKKVGDKYLITQIRLEAE